MDFEDLLTVIAVGAVFAFIFSIAFSIVFDQVHISKEETEAQLFCQKRNLDYRPEVGTLGVCYGQDDRGYYTEFGVVQTSKGLVLDRRRR